MQLKLHQDNFKIYHFFFFSKLSLLSFNCEGVYPLSFKQILIAKLNSAIHKTDQKYL